MEPVEKAARHAKLYKVVTTHTSHTWATVLVKMLLGQMGLQGMARQTPYIPEERLQRLYLNARKRLFLFDYDVCCSSLPSLFSLSLSDCHGSLIFFFRALWLRSLKSLQRQFHLKLPSKPSKSSLPIHRTSYTSSQDETVVSWSNI